jgi:C1A family cysteine protease
MSAGVAAAGQYDKPGEADLVFEQFRAWCQDYRQAGPTQRQASLEAGRIVAAQRRQVLCQLIVRDPGRALKTAVTATERRELPAEVLALLEERVGGVGDIRMVPAATANGGVSSDGLARVATIGGRSFTAFVYGARLNDQDFLQTPFWGIALDDCLAIAESPVRVLDVAEVPLGQGLPGQWAAVVGDETLFFNTQEELAEHECQLMYPTGAKVPGPEEMAEIAAMPRIRHVQPNQLGWQRINAARQKKGLMSLSREGSTAAPSGTGAELITDESSVPTLAGSESSPLPGSVDNSQLQYFPPIRSQGSINSCAAFATTYYQMTYMTALVRGWDAKNGGYAFRFSPKWTYNMVNGGNDSGSSQANCLGVGEDHGLATWAEFPYDGSSVATNYRAWCLNAAVWRAAISNRMNTYSTITSMHTADGLANLKAALNNGYVATFTTYSPWTQSGSIFWDKGWIRGVVTNDPATSVDDPYVGQSICRYVRKATGATHAMTIVGYNDDIWCDLNTNGIVDVGEKGALKIANSWGTAWGTDGYAWFAYDAIKTVSAVPGWNPTDKFYGIGSGDYEGNVFVYVVTARTNYTPTMLAGFTINHGKRDQVSMRLGKDNTSVTNNPAKMWWPKGLSWDGGPYAFDGTTNACDGQFWLDLTAVAPEPNVLKRYFVGFADSFTNDTGQIKSYTLVNVSTRETNTVTPGTFPASFNPSSGLASNSTVWAWIDSFGPVGINVTVPAGVAEGNGTLANQGTVTVSRVLSFDLTINLSSSDASEATVSPPSVTIAAGQTSAPFTVCITDDAERDGTQVAIITASATDFSPGSALLAVNDNEIATLAVSLPASASEGSVLTNAGTVTVNAPVAADVTVALVSSAPDEVTVPGSVIIPAGQTSSAPFSLTIPNDWQVDGTQTATITAHVDHWIDGSSTMTVLDIGPGPVDHFAWSTPAPTQRVGSPFGVVLTALDISNNVATSFVAPVQLAGWISNQVVIGAGCDTSSFPLTSNMAARTQVIYPASDLGGPCMIRSLALNVVNVTKGGHADGPTLNNWTIRLKHTALTHYAAGPTWESNDGWTVCHAANITVTNTGWVTFVFNTPFIYGGTSNILVDFSFSGNWSGSAAFSEQTLSAENRAIYFGGNTQPPVNWTGSNPVPVLSAYVPNIRLGTEVAVSITPTNTECFVSGVWTGNVAVLEASSNIVLFAEDAQGHSGQVQVPSVVALTAVESWQRLYFNADQLTQFEVSGDHADPDYDGLLNWMERVAGTNPTNALSRLALSAPTNNPISAGQFVVCWQSVSGRTYAVMMATNLMAGFNNLATNIPATPPMNVHTDNVNNAPTRFYRVKVE